MLMLIGIILVLGFAAVLCSLSALYEYIRMQSENTRTLVRFQEGLIKEQADKIRIKLHGQEILIMDLNRQVLELKQSNAVKAKRLIRLRS